MKQTTSWHAVAVQPRLVDVVTGELCDIRMGRGGCGAPAERRVLDADGRERALCGAHVAKYFPLVTA